MQTTTTRSIVHVHQNAADEGQLGTLFAGTPNATPYTFFTVYNKRQARTKKFQYSHYPLMFIGNHFRVLRNMPLLLETDEKGVPQRLFARPYGKPVLLWEKPRGLPEWVGIYETEVIGQGPYSFRFAPTIAVIQWPEDDYYHIYVPKSGLTETAIGLLSPYGPCFVVNSRSTRQGDYDVLYFHPFDEDKCSPSSILLDNIENSDIVFYWE